MAGDLSFLIAIACIVNTTIGRNRGGWFFTTSFKKVIVFCNYSITLRGCQFPVTVASFSGRKKDIAVTL